MIELSGMIGQLRHELTVALADGADQRVPFELGPVQIESAETAERSADTDADGMVRFWVMAAGGHGSRSRSAQQWIILSLTQRAVAPDGAPRTAMVLDRRSDGER